MIDLRINVKLLRKPLIGTDEITSVLLHSVAMQPSFMQMQLGLR